MSDIDEIKSRLNIVDIVSARIPLKKAGRNFKALCPFHNEKTPSFIVSPDRQTFHCFGCGKGGSVIDWVMEYERVDFMEALETLAEKAGVKLEHRFDETPQSRLRAKILEVNHLASEFYHYLLTSHKLGERAREYLKTRGVSDKTAKTFMLGYSPNSWDGLLKYLRKKGYDEELMETAGLVIKSSGGGYDRFRGRVMFALRDHRGNVVGFSGRLMDFGKNLPAGRQEAKYINTSETPVYIKGNVLYGLDVTKSAIQKENEAIIVEGEFDVISLFQEGIGNVVAIKGSALTEGHVNLLKRFTEQVTFALDADLAGDTAARRGIEIAEWAGLDLKVVNIPEGKDPDEAVRENAASFKKAIKASVPIYDYFISSAVRRFDSTSAFGKKKISSELFPIFASIENPVVQAHYIKKLAGALDVTEDVIGEGMRKAQSSVSSTGRTKEKDAEEKPKFSLQEKLETYTLALILQTRTTDFFEELKGKFQLADFLQPGVRRILEALDMHLASVSQFLVRDFADSLPKELVPILDEAFLWDLSGIIDNDELVSREWFKTLNELRRTVLRRKIKDMTHTVKSLEEETDTVEYARMQQAIAKLSDELGMLEKM